MEKYFINKAPNNGEVIAQVFYDYVKDDDKILFIRTPTTGAWIDDIKKQSPNLNITHILYQTPKQPKRNDAINHEELEDYLKKINKTFDIIAIDSFHEYSYSLQDFNLCNRFLSENGLLLSHDCYPSNKTIALPLYKLGGWCGETYKAFVRFAYDNPQYYYCLLNTDTGVGIYSKTLRPDLIELKTNLNRELQLEFLNKSEEFIWDFFNNNSALIINALCV